ncbi:hypothetical protein K8612_26665 [Corallococcus sp. AS-1-6]|nr:hypothetical protein [Corallococcus sp. AS-1-6]
MKGAPQHDGLKLGDCTKDVWRDLSKAVGSACKTQSMSCNATMSCVDLTVQWNRFENCIQARRTLMNRCFRGGDAEHGRHPNSFGTSGGATGRTSHGRRCATMRRTSRCSARRQ